ncbi:recombinase family protein [Pseudomonas sp. SA3-5]|uniref:Recombinase family protein n=1 Tax=Pseudomonas aestuarii TaxID=3018340 RepID=A0ABT4XJ59_9PSED|nr:recombinase family protein [Pseudomonas aestuarii]MDA7088254.1 recombinase family protein [Pseudomonas aestuarii]
MPTAFSYVRFSSAQQAHGASFQRQQDMIAGWLLKHPTYTLSTSSFQDLGISGYSGKHLDNGFGKLLAAVEAGSIQSGDVVLIEAIDRAGRLEPMEMLPLLSKVVNAGVNIVTLDDGITYNRESVNSNHLFLLVAKVQQAYQYSDALSRRIKDAYQRKREKAAAGGGVKRRTPLWLDAEGRLVDDIAPFIVQVFEDYAAGIGERRIMARIRGKHELLESLNPSTVKKWLRNPTAMGNWGDTPDVYPAVVSKDLFYRVQKRLQAAYKPKGASSQYLLSGLVKCGRCGANFGVLNTGRSPLAMVCMSRHRLGASGCSNSKSLPYTVLDYIRSQTSHSALQRAAQSQHLTANEKREIAIEGELTQLHQQSTTVVDALAEYGKLPAIVAKLNTITSTIEKLEAERALLKATAAPLSLDDVIEAENDFLDDDPIKLNALLQGAGYAIHCDDKTITVHEASFQGDSTTQTYRYSHVSRPSNTYVLFHADEEIRLRVPNAERDAAELAEFLAQPITQHLVYRDGEFVEAEV